MISKRRHDESETKILKRLAEGPADHAGKKHIVRLLGRFAHKGTNGRHLCIVLEALGQKASEVGHC